MSTKIFSVLILVLGLALLPQAALARGTAAGTVITNAKVGNANNAADLPGEVVGSFTNAGGYTNFSRATNLASVTVTAGYDLNVIDNINGSAGSPGGTVSYNYYLTNRGNISALVTVRISSNVIHPQWGLCQYEIWTNYGAGLGRLSGPANWISNQLKALAADAGAVVQVRVLVPGAAQDSSSNRYFLEVWDPAGFAGAGTGDAWPGANAILPATSDAANARDYQSDYARTVVTGPVIALTKAVDITTRRPYEDIMYTIRYTNTGSGPAYNVTVDDVIYTNYARIIANSAETNSNPHSRTNYYWDGATWQPATWDTGNENLVQRVRFVLRTPVAAGEGGKLRFSVRVE